MSQTPESVLYTTMNPPAEQTPRQASTDDCNAFTTNTSPCNSPSTTLKICRASFWSRMVKNVKHLSDTDNRPTRKGAMQTCKRAPLIRKSLKQRNKAVNFSSVIETIPQMYEKDATSTWYNAEEHQLFVQDGRNLVEELSWECRLSAVDPTSWNSHHRRIYEAACLGDRAENILDDLKVEKMGGATFDVTVLGMERKVIPFISADILDRRLQIYKNVFAAQKLPLRCENLRYKKIREASMLLSRPSKQYARCAAKISAAADLACCGDE